jgi:phosphotransferase system  glucose/maltose/N-acetylglucosamine-specific IIC component
MAYWIGANIVLIVHLGFIIFVVCGGFLILKWKWSAFCHLPAVIWGALLEFNGWICPLTPLEQWLRAAGGQKGYSGGFIEHYLLSILYPAGLTQDIQILLGAFVVIVNGAIYFFCFYHFFIHRQAD